MLPRLGRSAALQIDQIACLASVAHTNRVWLATAIDAKASATSQAEPTAPKEQGPEAATTVQPQINPDGVQTAAQPEPRLTIDAPLPSFFPSKERRFKDPVPLSQALNLVKANAKASFDETVELALNLGTNPKRGDQAVRGTVMLPHGLGKAVRVAVFAENEDAQAARAAGADVVGGADLVQQIADGTAPAFDKAVAVPAMMPQLGKVARILGPRGLMPNPKLGTVTADVRAAVRLLKTGRVEFRADRTAVLHAGVGKVSFTAQQLQDNLGALCDALLRARPKGVKGSGAAGYFLKATVSSTMGPGVPVALSSLTSAAPPRREH